MGVLLAVLAIEFGSLLTLGAVFDRSRLARRDFRVGISLLTIAVVLVGFRHRVTVYGGPRRLVRRRGFIGVGLPREFELLPDACVEIIHPFAVDRAQWWRTVIGWRWVGSIVVVRHFSGTLVVYEGFEMHRTLQCASALSQSLRIPMLELSAEPIDGVGACRERSARVWRHRSLFVIDTRIERPESEDEQSLIWQRMKPLLVSFAQMIAKGIDCPWLRSWLARNIPPIQFETCRFDDELLVVSRRRLLAARRLKSGKWRFVQLAVAVIEQVVVASATTDWEWIQSRAMAISIRASKKTVDFGGGLPSEDLEELRGLLVEHIGLETADNYGSIQMSG